MAMARNIGSIRSISISQSSKVAKVSSPVLISSKTQAPALDHQQPSLGSDSISFTTLNSPATVLHIRSPASYPLYVRKGSIISIYGQGATLSQVKSSFQFLDPIKSVVFGGEAIKYQRLISTSPYSVLLSSISKSSFFRKSVQQKSFATLELDGTSDWAILDKDSLQAYAGPSLQVSIHRLPSTISRKFALSSKMPLNTSTGLSKWPLGGFTFLTGRGNAAVVGNGTIYQAQLAEGEETLISRDNLIAVSLNGPFDLHNFVAKYSLVNSKRDSKGAESDTPVEAGKVVAANPSVSSQMSNLNYYIRVSLSALLKIKSSIMKMFATPSKGYVKIVGPRTLLLQSSRESIVSNDIGVEVKNTENYIVSSNDLERKAADYLNYVTITDKGAVFESTPDFKESATKLK